MTKATFSAVLAGVATVTALAVTTTRAGISVSNRLTAPKDARVLVSTLTPKAAWRGPYTWRVTIDGADTLWMREPDPQPAIDDASGTTLMLASAEVDRLIGRARQITDTVWQPFPSPTCAQYRVTAFPAIVLTSTGRVSTKRDSVYKTVKLCRDSTRTERAIADSFPPSMSAHITTCGAWAYRLSPAGLDSLLTVRLARDTSAADSTKSRAEIARLRTQPDSVPIAQPWSQRDSALMALVGYTYPLGFLVENRYTGRMQVLSGSDRCEATARLWDAERVR